MTPWRISRTENKKNKEQITSMSNFDFRTDQEPISDEKIRQYQDFEGLIRNHSIKSGRNYRRSSDVPFHRSKWVVMVFMAICAFALFGGILGFFVTSNLMQKEKAPTEQGIEKVQTLEKKELLEESH